MHEKLREKIKEALVSVLPITIIVQLLSVSLAPMDVGTALIFIVGAACLIIGMGFFQLGAEMAMTPFGKGIGQYLNKKKKIWLIIISAFVMGVLITIAEPDLQVLADQVASIPSRLLICGVGRGGVSCACRYTNLQKDTAFVGAYCSLYGAFSAFHSRSRQLYGGCL